MKSDKFTTDFSNFIHENKLYTRCDNDIPCFKSAEDEDEIVIHYKKNMYKICTKRKREDSEVVTPETPKKKRKIKNRENYMTKPKKPEYVNKDAFEILNTVNDEPTRLSYEDKTFFRLYKIKNKWTYNCNSIRSGDKCYCGAKIYYDNDKDLYDVSNACKHSDDCLEK